MMSICQISFISHSKSSSCMHFGVWCRARRNIRKHHWEIIFGRRNHYCIDQYVQTLTSERNKMVNCVPPCTVTCITKVGFLARLKSCKSRTLFYDFLRHSGGTSRLCRGSIKKIMELSYFRQWPLRRDSLTQNDKNDNKSSSLFRSLCFRCAANNWKEHWTNVEHR